RRARFAAALDSSIDDETDEEFETGTEAVVNEINLTLGNSGSVPQLVKHDGWDWHLHATGSSASLADRVAADVALVLIDLIRSGDLDRLGRCAADDCRAYLADFRPQRSHADSHIAQRSRPCHCSPCASPPDAGSPPASQASSPCRPR